LLPVIAALASLSVLAGCGNREPECAEGGAAAGAAIGARRPASSAVRSALLVAR
jgi:hypothetical protein